MKIADVVLKIAIEAEIKNSLGKKEVFDKSDVIRVSQIVSKAIRDRYLEDQPPEEESRQCTRLGRG